MVSIFLLSLLALLYLTTSKIKSKEYIQEHKDWNQVHVDVNRAFNFFPQSSFLEFFFLKF